MRFYGKRRTYPKRKTTKRRTYKRRSTRVNLATKRYVNRTIHKNMENKIVNPRAVNQTITSYAANTSLNVVSMVPYSVIAQGVGAGDRIGNKIRTRKCIFSFVLTPNAYSLANNPIPIPQDVMLFFGKVKNSRAQAPISTDFARLFQDGDSFSAPSSNLLDLTRDVNKDWFSVYKILKFKVGYSQYSGNGNQLPPQFYNNNDYKMNIVRKIDLTKYCPKQVVFNDTTSQNTNDGLWMWAMSVPADGSTNTTTYIPCQISWTLKYEFEDA